MKRHVPYMMASGLIAAILLAGCSSNTDTASSSAAGSQTAQTQSDGTDAQPAASSGARDRGMNRVGMNIGKIKNISGSTITVYTAEMPAGREGSGGTAPQGLANPPEGGGRQGGMPGGGMMQNFSGETTDITVDSDTQFVSVTFDNGEQKETVISLADLKADDVIQYTLKTDTTNAEKITLGAGGFGGGGNGQGKGGSSAAGSGS
jgi:hypothetical protein